MRLQSVFPAEIDERVFFQDVSLDQLQTYNEYQNLLATGQYSKASELLLNSDITAYSAEVFNYFERKLYNIETETMRRVSEIEAEKADAIKIASKLRLTYYGSTEPTYDKDVSYDTKCIAWISD